MEFFRSKHAERSRDALIKRRQEKVERDIIPGHMREAVAQIDYCHGGPPEHILSLKRCQNGFHGGDFIHPRFVAALLRLGDLMDMETTRFNPYIIDGLARISSDNMAYMLKDLSVSEILVSPHTICVTSSFEEKFVQEFLTRHRAGIGSGSVDSEEVRKYISSAIKTMRGWMETIRMNARWIWEAWSDIAPEDFPGSIASPKKLTILYEGRPYEEDDLELRYEIAPRRAAKIMEGSALYKDPLVFLREIIQNAIDATKRQLFRRFREEIIDEKTGAKMSLVAFMEKYRDELEAHAVEVSVCFDEALTKMSVVVIDKGIGITRNRLRSMRHIGAELEPDLEKEVARIPEWLRPTARFGIGMQSAFLVADRFSIRTNPRDRESNGDDMQHRIVFNSTRLGGDITSIDRLVPNCDECWELGSGKVCPDGPRYPRGTRFQIDIDLENPTGFIGSLIDSDRDGGFPYRISLKHALVDSCQNLLEKTFTEEFVPIRVEIAGRHPPLVFGSVPFAQAQAEDQFSNVRFQEIDGLRCIYYWYDTEHDKKRFCAMYKFTPTKQNDLCFTKLYFRGIRFSEREQPLLGAVSLPGYRCDVNIMSGNANDWLDVNRDRVRMDRVSIVRRNLVNGIGAFVHDYTGLAARLVAENDNDSPVSQHVWHALAQSPDFAKMLIVHAIVDSAGRHDAVVDYIAGTMGGAIETALIDKNGASIAFAPEPITKNNRPKARFIDFSAYEQESKILLDKDDGHLARKPALEDSEISATMYSEGYEQADEKVVNKAIRNSFSIFMEKKYMWVEVYKKNEAYRKGIVKIYELGDGAKTTEMDRISYFTLIEYTTTAFETNSYDGFPVFPAPISHWFEGTEIISLKEKPPVPHSMCDSRFSSFAFAPFPVKILKSVLETIGAKGDGKERILEIRKDARWGQYYEQAIQYIKQFGGAPKGHDDKKVEDKILSAWGNYADFLAGL